MKTERLLSILMILLHRRKITASELADYFEVSVRTIQRDMDSLAVAGIPLYASVGKDGGYQLIDTYRLDDTFLTKDEMDTLIAVLSGFRGTLTNHSIRTIFEKLHGLPQSESAFDKLVINLNPWGADPQFKETLRRIESAIDQKKLLHFTYYDLYNNETSRTVEPYTLVLKVNTWYLFAFCRLRKDYRFFKALRMFDLSVQEAAFSPREDMPQHKPWEELDYSRPAEPILLKFQETARARISDLFGHQGWTGLADGSILITCYFPIDEWVISLILSYGSEVEVLKPLSLRQEIIRRIEENIEIYQTNS